MTLANGALVLNGNGSVPSRTNSLLSRGASGCNDVVLLKDVEYTTEALLSSAEASRHHHQHHQQQRSQHLRWSEWVRLVSTQPSLLWPSTRPRVARALRKAAAMFVISAVVMFGIFEVLVMHRVARLYPDARLNARFSLRSDEIPVIYRREDQIEADSWAVVDSRSILARERACSISLLNTHKIPVILLRAMSADQRAELCDELSSRTLYVPDPENSSGTVAESPGVLFAHVDFGLGNRLRALGSLMALASGTGRALVVIWERNAHLNASFHDLFHQENDLLVIERFDAPAWPWCPETGPVPDDNCRAITAINLIARENPSRVHPSKLFIGEAVHRNLYIKTAYFVNSGSAITTRPNVPHAPANVFLRRLISAPKIQQRVLQRVPQDITERVGVHVRSLSIEKERDSDPQHEAPPAALALAGAAVDVRAALVRKQQTLEAESEYGKDNVELTNLWRSRTGVDAFVAQMQAEGENQKFYVASDSRESVERLKEMFPGRIESQSREECGRPRDAACVELALVDLIALSLTRRLLGSHYSSFSEVATRLGNGDALFAGRDFTARTVRAKSCSRFLLWWTCS